MALWHWHHVEAVLTVHQYAIGNTSARQWRYTSLQLATDIIPVRTGAAPTSNTPWKTSLSNGSIQHEIGAAPAHYWQFTTLPSMLHQYAIGGKRFTKPVPSKLYQLATGDAPTRHRCHPSTQLAIYQKLKWVFHCGNLSN